MLALRFGSHPTAHSSLPMTGLRSRVVRRLQSPLPIRMAMATRCGDEPHESSDRWMAAHRKSADRRLPPSRSPARAKVCLRRVCLVRAAAPVGSAVRCVLPRRETLASTPILCDEGVPRTMAIRLDASLRIFIAAICPIEPGWPGHRLRRVDRLSKMSSQIVPAALAAMSGPD